MTTPPSESRTATPKSIELGHVVVNVHTGVAARVRGLSPRFGPFDDQASVLVEIGRIPWGHEEEWLRSDVVLAGEWQAHEDARRREQPRFPLLKLRPIHRFPARIDRRLRTSPHGDALDTTVRSIWEEGAWDFGDFTDLASPALVAHYRARLKLNGEPPAISFLNENCGDHFRRLWWDAPRVVDAGGRLTPGVLKLAGARIMAGPGGDVAKALVDQIDFEWEARRWEEPAGDAEAAANGMGC